MSAGCYFSIDKNGYPLTSHIRDLKNDMAALWDIGRPEATLVNLTVYNALGQEVVKLADGRMKLDGIASTSMLQTCQAEFTFIGYNR